jgi:hypothetical protein
MATIRDSSDSVEEIDYSKYNIGNLWSQDAIVPKTADNLRPIVDVAGILGGKTTNSVFDIANTIVDTGSGGGVGAAGTGGNSSNSGNTNGIGGINGTGALTGNNIGNSLVGGIVLGLIGGLIGANSKAGDMVATALGLPSNNSIANTAEESNSPVGLQGIAAAMQAADMQAAENDNSRNTPADESMTSPSEQVGISAVSPADVAAALSSSISDVPSIGDISSAIGASDDSGAAPNAGESPDSGVSPSDNAATPDSGEAPSTGESPNAGESPDSGASPSDAPGAPGDSPGDSPGGSDGGEGGGDD